MSSKRKIINSSTVKVGMPFLCRVTLVLGSVWWLKMRIKAQKLRTLWSSMTLAPPSSDGPRYLAEQHSLSGRHWCPYWLHGYTHVFFTIQPWDKPTIRMYLLRSVLTSSDGFTLIFPHLVRHQEDDRRIQMQANLQPWPLAAPFPNQPSWRPHATLRCIFFISHAWRQVYSVDHVEVWFGESCSVWITHAHYVPRGRLRSVMHQCWGKGKERIGWD